MYENAYFMMKTLCALDKGLVVDGEVVLIGS